VSRSSFARSWPGPARARLSREGVPLPRRAATRVRDAECDSLSDRRAQTRPVRRSSRRSTTPRASSPTRHPWRDLSLQEPTPIPPATLRLHETTDRPDRRPDAVGSRSSSALDQSPDIHRPAKGRHQRQGTAYSMSQRPSTSGRPSLGDDAQPADHQPRDEPHADPRSTGAPRHASADSNMSEFATYLKIGTPRSCSP